MLKKLFGLIIGAHLPSDLPIVEVWSLASNKHLNNTIRVYHLLSHFEEMVREEKETTEGSESDRNGNDMKSLFQNPTTIYERNGEKLVIGV